MLSNEYRRESENLPDSFSIEKSIRESASPLYRMMKELEDEAKKLIGIENHNLVIVESLPADVNLLPKDKNSLVYDIDTNCFYLYDELTDSYLVAGKCKCTEVDLNFGQCIECTKFIKAYSGIIKGSGNTVFVQVPPTAQIGDLAIVATSAAISGAVLVKANGNFNGLWRDFSYSEQVVYPAQFVVSGSSDYREAKGLGITFICKVIAPGDIGDVVEFKFEARTGPNTEIDDELHPMAAMVIIDHGCTDVTRFLGPGIDFSDWYSSYGVSRFGVTYSGFNPAAPYDFYTDSPIDMTFYTDEGYHIICFKMEYGPTIAAGFPDSITTLDQGVNIDHSMMIGYKRMNVGEILNFDYGYNLHESFHFRLVPNVPRLWDY